jgi:hypothetical protein
VCGSRARIGQGSKALKGEVVQGMRVRTPREEEVKSRRDVYWEGKGGGREGEGCVGRSAQGPVRSELKSERFCGKGAKSAARRARPARPPEGRRADAHAERRERDNEQQMPGQASL